MTKLEATIARLRALPEAQQEGVAAQIDLMLGADEDLLSPEEWADVEARLDQDEGMTPHAEVVRTFHDRFR